VNAWVTWAHGEGFKARNQAHGAPGNLLDLYGAADIPETESFGLTELPIVGLRGDAVGVSIDPDPPSVTIGRFASSAAHVMGKTLISSETLTWLRENFRESPCRREAAARPVVRRGHQSHLLSRHRVLASRRRMAWLVFLRIDAAHAVQSTVGRFRRDACLCRARAVSIAGGRSGQRHPVVLAFR
jgi:hypothetical protein